jgi:hypothetical protein
MPCIQPIRMFAYPVDMRPNQPSKEKKRSKPKSFLIALL